jgi:hypothetical protein
MRFILFLSTLAACTAACTTPAPTAPPAPAAGAYQAKGGVLYAWDGRAWYSLVRDQVNFNDREGIPEQWHQVGGSQVITYRRTPATRDGHGRPVFLAN